MLEHVGRNLKRLRRERDLTQVQIARLAGIHQQDLSLIERGHLPRELAIVDRLAKALAVNVNELLKATA